MKPVDHFCVNCGVRLEPRTVEGRALEGCDRCGFVLWHDPKVVTMVVVENDSGEVVVGRRGIEPGYGLWCLPGGYVNDDEHPADSAVRECREPMGERPVPQPQVAVQFDVHVGRPEDRQQVIERVGRAQRLLLDQ